MDTPKQQNSIDQDKNHDVDELSANLLPEDQINKDEDNIEDNIEDAPHEDTPAEEHQSVKEEDNYEDDPHDDIPAEEL